MGAWYPLFSHDSSSVQNVDGQIVMRAFRVTVCSVLFVISVIMCAEGHPL